MTFYTGDDSDDDSDDDIASADNNLNNDADDMKGCTIAHQKLSNGTVMAVISVDSDYIEKNIVDGASTATINICSKVTDDDSIQKSQTEAAEDLLVSDNKSSCIITGKGDVMIPTAWLKALHATGRKCITLTITPQSDDGTAKGLVSDGIYNITLTAGGQQISKLGQSITITIPLNKSKVKNPERVIACTYNNTTGGWQTLGGTVNRESGMLTFGTSHLSTFAAFENSKSFDDITSDWAKNAVETLASCNLINRISNNRLNPYGNITRVEFTALIVRSLYVDLSKSKGTFTDVTVDSRYADLVETAYNLGLVTGNDKNAFEPDANITREQLAVIAYRLYKYKNGTASENTKNTFMDSWNISKYARSAVSFVQSTGVMQGSGTMFYPKQNTTRQEAAVVLYRLLKYMGEI